MRRAREDGVVQGERPPPVTVTVPKVTPVQYRVKDRGKTDRGNNPIFPVEFSTFPGEFSAFPADLQVRVGSPFATKAMQGYEAWALSFRTGAITGLPAT